MAERRLAFIPTRILFGMLTTLVIAGALAARKRWIAGDNGTAAPDESLIIIVGAGVAGLSAAVEALERGARVLLIDKQARLGGNSIKASSGVNAVQTSFQRELAIEDSSAAFVDDIVRSGRGYSIASLARVLADRSGHAIDTAAERLGLDFGDVNALGGHSRRRTHRFPPLPNDPRPFGAVLVKALSTYLERYREPEHLQVPSTPIGFVHNFFTPIQVPQFVYQESTSLVDFEVVSKPLEPPVAETVPGSPRSYWSALSTPRGETARSSIPSVDHVEQDELEDAPYVKSVTLRGPDGQEFVYTNVKALVLTAGGFGGDTLSADSLIQKYRPDLAGFPTTNELSATGDVHKIAIKNGLEMFELDQVQLHPTAFINVNELHAPTKFLCPEVLRSLGGVLLNSKGDRFVNELDTRDTVSAAILAHGGKESDWLDSTSEYIKQDSTSTQGSPSASPRAGQRLAQDQSMALIAFDSMTATRFGEAVLAFYLKKQLIWPIAQLSKLTKNFSIEKVREAADVEVAYVALITPAVHYTTGGILVDELTRALRRVGSDSLEHRTPLRGPLLNSEEYEAVQNLFVAGEAAGGLHGHNRLGGNGMCECMVFGALAGEMSTLASVVAKEFPRDQSEMVQSQIVLIDSADSAEISDSGSSRHSEEDQRPSPMRCELGKFTLSMPDLSTRLKKDARIDHLFVEASQANREPVEFKDIRVTNALRGLIEVECRGDHSVSGGVQGTSGLMLPFCRCSVTAIEWSSMCQSN